MTVLDALGNMIAACEVAKIAFCRLPRHANGLCCLTGVGGCVVMTKAVEELELSGRHPAGYGLRLIVVGNEVGVDVGRMVDKAVDNGHGRLEVLVSTDQRLRQWVEHRLILFMA